MMRLDEQQTCPPFQWRPNTAHFTALSRSASSSTMKASEPPSSIVDFFSALPAWAATRAPAPSEPVRATPCTRGSLMIVSIWPRVAYRFWKHPAGNPVSCISFSKAAADCGTLEACFRRMTLPAASCGAMMRAIW